MPTIIGLRDLRENTAHYIATIRNGAEYVVMQRSRPVFRISPIQDEWGDGGDWVTLADFSNESGGGVPVQKLIKALEKSLAK